MGKTFVMELKLPVRHFKLVVLSWIICWIQVFKAEWEAEESITETGWKGRKTQMKQSQHANPTIAAEKPYATPQTKTSSQIASMPKEFSKERGIAIFQLEVTQSE